MSRDKEMHNNGGNGSMRDYSWPKHEEYVLTELHRLGGAIERVGDSLHTHMKDESETVSDIKVELAKLNTKITMWGSIIAAAATVAQPLISSALEKFFR